MKVINTSNGYIKQAYNKEVSENKRTAERKSESAKKTGSVKNGDTVSLSSGLKEMQIAKNAVGDLPDITEEPDGRLKKIEDIRQSYEDGSYQIDIEQTVEKILGTHLF